MGPPTTVYFDYDYAISLAFSSTSSFAVRVRCAQMRDRCQESQEVLAAGLGLCEAATQERQGPSLWGTGSIASPFTPNPEAA